MDEIMIVMICERMHWSYKQFEEAPMWLVNGISTMLQIEAEKRQEGQSK